MSSEEKTSRTKVIREVLIFQVKLWLEGFKDFVLMPLSLGAALLDVVFHGSDRRTLHSVMRMGNRFEQWVHLYASLEESTREKGETESTPRSLDHLLNDAADGIEQQAASRSKKEES